MNRTLIEIYKNRIEIFLNGLYQSIFSRDSCNIVEKNYEGLKKIKPTDDDFIRFRELEKLKINSQEYKTLYTKLSNWKVLNSCVDYDYISLAELVDLIIDLENELQIEEKIIAVNTINQNIENEFLLFFDTETTGLPKKYDAPVSDLNNWPRLVQLAYILCDKNGKTIQKGDWIIKPNGFSIPKESSNLHRITNEIAISEGLPLSLVLENFNNLIKHSDSLIAHNISFDEKIIGAEFLRNNMINPLPDLNRICTMLKSTNFCKINGPYGYKWPKLSELHLKLFGENFEEAHNAAYDIEATAKCYWELKRRDII